MKVEEIIDGVVARFIGSKHERDIKKIQPRIDAINVLAPEFEALTDAELLAKTAELRAVVQAKLAQAPADDPEYLRSWEYKQLVNEALDLVLEPAFAAVREAGRRFLGMRHFDVQLIGGVVLFLIQNLLSASHVSPYGVDIVNGGALVFALALSQYLDRRRRSRGTQLDAWQHTDVSAEELVAAHAVRH